jgi:transcriptional regulator NrdR family protein
VVPDRVIFETAGVAGQALGYSESGHRAAAIRRRRMNDTETTRLATIDQQKLAALKALKKSLLHQAFSGEL